MANATIGAVLLVLISLLYSNGETVDDVQRVLDQRFAPTKYNKMVRGVIDQDKPVEVNLTFNLLSLSNVNAAEETMEVMGALYVSWVDERLVWDPMEFNNTKMVHAFQDDIWKPEIVMANPATELTVLGNDRIMATVYYNGSVQWNVGGLLKFHCSLNVVSYPWDIQTCPLSFIVWGYYSHEVALRTPSDEINLRNYPGNGAWEILSATATSVDDSIQKVLFTFKIRRITKFPVVNYVVPIFTMVFLNLFAFIIPPESGEKLSYCITVLLALTVFHTMIADYLPENSNNMAFVCYYLMFNLMISTLICISSVLSIRFYHMSEKSIPPRWLRRAVVTLSCKKISQKVKPGSFKDTDNTPIKTYQRDSVEGAEDIVESTTWSDVGRCFNNVACVVTITLLVASTVTFASFTMSTQSE